MYLLKRLSILFCLLVFQNLSAQETINFNTVHDGLDRDYSLYIPANYDPANKTPLVFNLHGFGSNASQQQFYSGMQFVADTEGFILCFPNGIDMAWNVGWEFGSTADDVGFISQVLDEISQAYNINAQRVYSCGMSNGGFMSYTLACELNDRIAAIASVTGAMAEAYVPNCIPDRSVPVMQIHGTADDVVLYEGTEGVNIPVEDVVQFWTNNNACGEVSDTIIVDDINMTDESTAIRIEYNQCDEEGPVVFYKIEGGGHTWAGASFVIGVTNQDFNASQEIWNFFERFENPILADTEDQKIVQSAFISPNPAQNFINIQMDQIKEYTLLNIEGKVLLKGKSDPRVNIQTLNSGLYFIKASSENGQSYISKFIKQ